MTLYDRDRHAGMAAMYGSHDPAVCGGMFAGRASAIMGLADESARLGEEAVTLARSLDHPFSLGLALTFRAASAQALGDHDAATVNADEATTIAREQGFRLMLGWCLAVSGWAEVQRGDADRGGAWIDEAIATTRATGSDQFLSYLMASRAEAYLAAGRPADALQAARDGFAAVARTAERFYEAELHRLQGEALLATDGDAVGGLVGIAEGGGRRNPARGEPLCASLSGSARPHGGWRGWRSRPARRRARHAAADFELGGSVGSRCPARDGTRPGSRVWRRIADAPCDAQHRSRSMTAA